MLNDWGESVSELLNGSILAFAQLSWEFIKSAFSHSNITDNWWITVVGGNVTTVVNGEESVIHHPGMMNVTIQIMVPILFILVLAQVVISAFRRSTIGMIRAFVGGVFSIPMTYIIVGIMHTVMVAFDQITAFVLSRGNGGGEEEAMAAILNMFGLTYDPKTKDVLMDENYQQWAIAKDSGNFGGSIVGLVIAFVIFVVCFLLVLMMAFRTLGLVILAAAAPVAIMTQTMEAARGIFMRWLGVVLGLLLAKPFAAMIVKMGMTMSSTSDDVFQMVVGIVAVLIGCAMPLVAVSFFAFTTGGASEGVERAGVQVGQAGRSASRGASRTVQRGTNSVKQTAGKAASAARIPARTR